MLIGSLGWDREVPVQEEARDADDNNLVATMVCAVTLRHRPGNNCTIWEMATKGTSSMPDSCAKCRLQARANCAAEVDRDQGSSSCIISRDGWNKCQPMTQCAAPLAVPRAAEVMVGGYQEAQQQRQQQEEHREEDILQQCTRMPGSLIAR